MKKLTDATALKEYINYLNIPDKYLALINEEQSVVSDTGEGLRQIGGYYFMCLALVPNRLADKLFNSVTNKIEEVVKEPEDCTYASLHSIPKDNQNKPIFVMSDEPDVISEDVAPLFKGLNCLKWSDEFDMEPSGFYDNDGGIISMDYELTLAVLRCQNFFNEQNYASLTGQKICFTGFRDELCKEKLESLGAEIVPNVTSKTTLVVSSNPDEGSSKSDKAEDLGIPVVSMFDLITKRIIPGSTK